MIPVEDEIHVLPWEKFKTLDDFYATCAHEIAHSIGHESRVKRDMNSQNKAEYAKEELRAELTTMFIARNWGIAFNEEHIKNHSGYLQSWAKALEDDPNELYRVVAKAQEMADYIEKNMILKGLELPEALVQEQSQEVMTTQNKGKDVGMVAEARAEAPKSKTGGWTSKRKVGISRLKEDGKSASMAI